MNDASSAKAMKVTDIQHGEVVQVGDNNNAYRIIKNCIINVTNYYNQPPPPPPVPQRDYTTKPYRRDVHVQVEKKAKKNGRPAGTPDRPSDQEANSHAVTTKTQTVVDSKGTVLEPGEWLEIGTNGNCIEAIFVGDGMVVTVDQNTSKVVKVPLDVNEHFSKVLFWFPSNVKYVRAKTAQKATGRVGQVFDGDDSDFTRWCCTYMNSTESRDWLGHGRRNAVC